MEMDRGTFYRIQNHCDDGNMMLEGDDCEGALVAFNQAWQLVPEPRERWEASTWILASIGDAYFKLQKFNNAITSFADAMHCPGGLGNAFIHLRLGQCAYELGDNKQAGDELARAYMAEGRDLFTGEDPKYFEFLKTVLKPPVGQTEL